MPRNYHHASGDPNLGDESAQDLASLSQHIGEWWGEGMVWHEIVSEYVHLDIHTIPPAKESPYHTLITTGMSDRAMHPPEGAESCGYCELLMALPATWPLDADAFKQEYYYWPLRHLKQTARFPHVVETWLWLNHTVGNGNDLDPVTAEAPFAGFMLATPKLSPAGAHQRSIRENKNVHFFALIPLYEAEIKFAWAHGSDDLRERLEAHGVTELIDVSRPCVITGRKPPGRRLKGRSKSIRDRFRSWWPFS
jgi:hypothetical protein